MYCGINIEHLVKIGAVNDETIKCAKEHYIREYKDQMFAKYPSMTIGFLRKLADTLRGELDAMPLKTLMCVTENDYDTLVANKLVEETIIIPLCEESVGFKRIIESEPTLCDDDFYDEYCTIYGIIDDMCNKHGKSSYGPDYTAYELLIVPTEAIKMQIRSHFLNLFLK